MVLQLTLGLKISSLNDAHDHNNICYCVTRYIMYTYVSGVSGI